MSTGCWYRRLFHEVRRRPLHTEGRNNKSPALTGLPEHGALSFLAFLPEDIRLHCFGSSYPQVLSVCVSRVGFEVHLRYVINIIKVAGRAWGRWTKSEGRKCIFRLQALKASRLSDLFLQIYAIHSSALFSSVLL
jgi:hypothetical protein